MSPQLLLQQQKKKSLYLCPEAGWSLKKHTHTYTYSMKQHNVLFKKVRIANDASYHGLSTVEISSHFWGFIIIIIIIKKADAKA